MTIDERLEFLVQSTESLHETVMEHSRQLAEQAKRMDALVAFSDENERRWNRLRKAMNAAFREWYDDEEGSEP